MKRADGKKSACKQSGLEPSQVEPTRLVPVAAHTTEAIRATAERSNHGQRLEVREGVQRVQDGVTVLLRLKGAEPAHRAAAERYLSDYMTGIEGVSEAEGARRGGGDIHTTMLARAGAVTRVTRLHKAIGTAGVLRLKLLVLEQMSFRAMAPVLFPKSSTSDARSMAAAQCALVLEQIAELYAEMDQERRPANGNRPKQAGTS